MLSVRKLGEGDNPSKGRGGEKIYMLHEYVDLLDFP